MIDAATISEIIKIYEKHGWVLRRVLLSAGLNGSLKDPARLFGTAEITASDIDAAWFSRASKGERETWEIRHLSEVPFALLEVIDNAAADSERNTILNDTDDRLRQAVNAKKASAKS